jgi:hypothetical protein
VLQDGNRVTIFTGNTLIRALDLDPSKTYNRSDEHSGPRTRHPHPSGATLLSAMS